MTASQTYLTLNDGASLPQLGLGVWRTPDDETAGVVRTALEAGYQSIDTAMIYGNEAGVGEGLKAAEGPVFVTTKLWNADQGFDSALRAFDRSAKLLGREVIDLYLIHWPVAHRGLMVDSWKALVRLKAEGRARSIGVSNFNAHHIDRIVAETGVMPAVNQIELHPYFHQLELRGVNAARGIVTESWSPLGKARLLEDPVIVAVAAKHGKTPAHVVIRWHIENGLMVIPKSVTPSRIRANIEVFDFTLDAEDMANIAALDDPQARIGGDPETFDP